LESGVKFALFANFVPNIYFTRFGKNLVFNGLRALVRPEGFLYGAMNSKIERMNKKGGREQVSGLDCIRHFLLERLCVVCIQGSGHPVVKNLGNTISCAGADQDMQIFGQVWFGKIRALAYTSAAPGRNKVSVR
jgi:hypothetical protein